MRQLAELLPGLRCDLCVLTGDFRGKTYGPFDATLDGLAQLRPRLPEPAYAVLGNHNFDPDGAGDRSGRHPGAAQ